jgi:hypothetical protein
MQPRQETGNNNLSWISTFESKLIAKVKDDAFDIEHLSDYQLCIQVNDESLRFCIINGSNNKLMLLEDYQLQGASVYRHPEEILHLLFEDHHLLKAGFWKSVKVCVKNKSFSLVPDFLFQNGHLKDYLKLLTVINEKEDHLSYYKQISTDAVNVFSTKKPFIEFFNKIYPSREVVMLHETSAIIEGVLRHQNEHSGRNMFVIADSSSFYLVVADNKKLEFCNIL